MKLKYEFVTTKIDDDYMAVPVGKNSEELKAVIKLNETANEIMELLKNDVTRDEIVTKLKEEYEDDGLEDHVDSFLKKLKDSNLLA